MSDGGATTNRPGQSAIAYRAGTHPTFLARMLARLPLEAVADGDNAGTRPLAALTTRAGDDPVIALLDAWAAAADVLTFYQERIANEGYLRTATERRSVLELARAIGYELSPGVAASVYLAFTVDDAAGAPGESTIAAGTQIQSVPAAQGELPQTFETAEAFEAKVEWNELRPQLTEPQALTTDATEVYLEGVATNVKAGDLLLLVVKTSAGAVETAAKRALSVETDSDNDRTLVVFEGDAGPGVETSPKTAFPAATVALGAVAFSGSAVDSMIVGQTWSESDLTAFLAMQGWSGDALLGYLAGASATLADADEGVFVLREKVGIFGHNAPYFTTLPDDTQDAYFNWDSSAWSIWKDSLKTESGEAAYYADADLFLERAVTGIVGGSWVVIERPTRQYQTYRVTSAADTSLAGFGISGRATGLELAGSDGVALEDDDKPATFKVRKTTAYVKSEQLTLADLPLDDAVAAGLTELTLDTMVLGLQTGQAVALTGEREDAAGVTESEILVVAGVTHGGGRTTLAFAAGLEHSYVRSTVVLNANIVRATHGETVAGEVMGSGDGAEPYQQFALRKSPLTHVSAATASGVESTLSVTVDGVEWEQADSLYGLDATSRRFVVRIDDDATATVVFGNGRSGARLPTGQENVVATYRAGIGAGGEVEAGRLTLMKTRPFGVRSVTNPAAASGAADPESLDDARANAPLAVLTLDRIVSLRDFEQFARAFAGIGRAQAVALWSGESRIVHITIAGAGGAAVGETSDLSTNLRAAIDAARDPGQEVRIESFQPLYFNVSAAVLVEAAYDAETVLAEARSALEEAFGFAGRSFGQPVSAAEVITVIHGVDGVAAVDLDGLYLVTEADEQTPTLASVLPAAIARWEDGVIQPAELLLVNAAGITLEAMPA